MTSMTTKARTRPSGRVRTGLAISAFLALAGAVPTPSRVGHKRSAVRHRGTQRNPQHRLDRLRRSGVALRQPAGYPDQRRRVASQRAHHPSGVLRGHRRLGQVGSTVVIVLTVAALVLTMRPEHEPFTVTD